METFVWTAILVYMHRAYLNKHLMSEAHKAWIPAHAQILQADHLPLPILVHLVENLQASFTPSP